MTKSAQTALIRALRAEDRPQWAALWREYLAFYDTTLPQAIYDAHLARLTGSDDTSFRGLVAEDAGQLLGLVHYVFHPHGWKLEPVCYLQDLFVSPAARGTGLGRALIEAVYKAADETGAPQVYWLTQANNHTGRQLYDRVGQLTDFIKYQRPA